MSSPVGGSFGGAEIRIGDVHSGSTEDVSASTVPQGLKVPPTEKTVRKQLSLGGLFKGIGKFLLGAAAFTGVLLLTGSNPIGLACLGAIAFCTTIAWLGRVKQSGGSGNSSAEQMSNKMSSAGQSANVAESLTGSGDAGAAEREKAEANELKVKLTRQRRAQEVELALGGTGGANATVTGLIENATRNALSSFESGGEGWLMMPPNTERAKLSETVKVGMGGVAMDGDWKIHFSIHPEDMAKAIPIIIRHTYDPSTPVADIKIATKALTKSPTHQIGKEAALIFSKETESSSEGKEGISQFLQDLWKAFHAAGIRPEPGKLATVASKDEILAAGDGVQVKEKKNIAAKKFNAQIRQPDGEEFFHYRFENVSVMDDESLVGVEDPRCLSYSQVDDLEDCYKHNPLKEEDFLGEIDLRALT
ncbi:MAG: hypothetical protein ACI8RA_000719 [Chlamydiales bacterium]|jgi:hypothetical protein